MINFIVTEFNPNAGAEVLPEQRERPRAQDSLHGVPLGKIGKYGFAESSPEKAEQYAQELAQDHPGKIYLVFSLVKGFECPPGTIIEKTKNQSGELVPTAKA